MDSFNATSSEGSASFDGSSSPNTASWSEAATASRTIDSLRRRLLAERAASKAAKESVEQNMKRLLELESLLESEIKLREKAEAAMEEVTAKLKRAGISADIISGCSASEDTGNERSESVSAPDFGKVSEEPNLEGRKIPEKETVSSTCSVQSQELLQNKGDSETADENTNALGSDSSSHGSGFAATQDLCNDKKCSSRDQPYEQCCPKNFNMDFRSRFEDKLNELFSQGIVASEGQDRKNILRLKLHEWVDQIVDTGQEGLQVFDHRSPRTLDHLSKPSTTGCPPGFLNHWHHVQKEHPECNSGKFCCQFMVQNGPSKCANNKGKDDQTDCLAADSSLQLNHGEKTSKTQCAVPDYSAYSKQNRIQFAECGYDHSEIHSRMECPKERSIGCTQHFSYQHQTVLAPWYPGVLGYSTGHTDTPPIRACGLLDVSQGLGNPSQLMNYSEKSLQLTDCLRDMSNSDGYSRKMRSNLNHKCHTSSDSSASRRLGHSQASRMRKSKDENVLIALRLAKKQIQSSLDEVRASRRT